MLGVLRVLLPGAAFAQTWPTLISLWQFDETSPAGGVFVDVGPANVPMNIGGTWADLSTDSMIQGIGGTSAYTGGSGYATIPANDPDHELSDLTISFYYQRNSAAAKHILLAASDALSTGVGDFSIEVLPNGRLRAFHVGQDAQLRFFESTDGITGTNLQVGTAHRIDLTLGSLGARIYLDGAPLTSAFILANTNGWNNARTKYLGRWIDDVEGPAEGAFDGLRIWDQQLTSGQIATLEPAQSIPLPGTTPPSSVDLSAPLEIFTPSEVQVTALAGWPAGRTPKEVIAQGTHAHGILRRSWKPNNNDGNWVNFWPGWQPTPAGQKTVISIELDNGSALDIRAEVSATVPTPSGTGMIRYLDASAAAGGNGTLGSPWNSWKTAIESLTAGSVLMVRAPAGSRVINGRNIPYSVYPLDVTSGQSATSTVNDVTIFADPVDLAAGRRPRIHINGSDLAGFFDDPNGMWELDPSDPAGNVWRSTRSTYPAPIQSVNGWYRGSTGRVCGLYDYFHPTQGAFLNQIRDTAYAKFSMYNVWKNTYMGPGVTFSGGRYYVRLSPPHPSTVCEGSAPNPPWHWNHYYAPSTNPNNVPMYFATTAGTTNANSCLRITSRTGWKIYNIDFVPGGYGIEANSTTNLQLFGCRFFGVCHLEHIDTDNTNFQGKQVRADSATGLLFDRCEFYGGIPPWVTWSEGKGWPGAWGPSMRNAFAEVRDAFYTARHCHFENFYHLVWGQGMQQPKHHHCTMLNCGHMDGLFVTGVPKSITQLIRCKLLNSSLAGWSGGTATTAAFHCINNLEVRMVPGFAGHRAAHNGTTVAVNDCNYVPLNLEQPHGGVGSGGEPGPWFRCQNTIIGTQRHMGAATAPTLGTGCGFSPHRNTQVCDKGKHWWAHNNIGAVYPSANGFLWVNSTGNGPNADSYVTWLVIDDPFAHIDYNHYFRHSGMPATGRSGLATVHTWGGGTVDCADIAAIRANSPHEDNGTSGDPGFIGPLTYPSAAPEDDSIYAPGAFQITGSSPAATGGNTGLSSQAAQDYDGNAQITYPGRAWRGCFVPDVLAIEQEVGPLGPMIT